MMTGVFLPLDGWSCNPEVQEMSGCWEVVDAANLHLWFLNWPHSGTPGRSSLGIRTSNGHAENVRRYQVHSRNVKIKYALMHMAYFGLAYFRTKERNVKHIESREKVRTWIVSKWEHPQQVWQDSRYRVPESQVGFLESVCHSCSFPVGMGLCRRPRS